MLIIIIQLNSCRLIFINFTIRSQHKMSIRKTASQPYMNLIQKSEKRNNQTNLSFRNEGISKNQDEKMRKQTITQPDCQKNTNASFDEQIAKKYGNKLVQGNKASRDFRFQLKCISKKCDEDDIHSVYTYGGYSVKSKINFPPDHNHKKLGHQTIFDYAENDIPEIQRTLNQKERKQETQKDIQIQKFEQQKKKKLKNSSFAPLFVSKLDKVSQHQKRIILEEANQKRVIHQCQKQRARQIEEQNLKKKKIKQLKKKIDLSQNKVSQVDNSNLKSNNKRLKIEGGKLKQLTVQNQQKQIKTRNQQKEKDVGNFQGQFPPRPNNHAPKYCYPCRIKYDDYHLHIETLDHKKNLHISLGTDYFLEQWQIIKKQERQELNSKQYRNLRQLGGYLQRIADKLQTLMQQKQQDLKRRCEELGNELQKLFSWKEGTDKLDYKQGGERQRTGLEVEINKV